jgi:hypothetical protein
MKALLLVVLGALGLGIVTVVFLYAIDDLDAYKVPTKAMELGLIQGENFYMEAVS